MTEVYIPFTERPTFLPLRHPRAMTGKQFDERFSPAKRDVFARHIVGLGIERLPDRLAAQQPHPTTEAGRSGEMPRELVAEWGAK